MAKWGGLYGRGGQRDIVRAQANLPAGATRAIVSDAIFGTPAGGTVNYSLVCETGAYSLSGADAGLRRGYRIVAETGAYTLTGSNAALSYARRLAAETGSYALSGADAALRRGYTLTLETGAYSLTGHDAGLTYDPGAINYTLVCETGVYALSGSDAGLRRGYSLGLNTGEYTLTGHDAGLTVGGGADNIEVSWLEFDPAGDGGRIEVSWLEFEPGEAVTQSGGMGFELVDLESRSWWKRKPKALPDDEAQEKIKTVAAVIERVVREKEGRPFSQVRAEIVPYVADMPGFDWSAMYRYAVSRLIEQRLEQAAAELARNEIERIRMIDADDEDILTLLFMEP